VLRWLVDLLILVEEARGAPDELMPGAWGASARSLPTFLVPDTGALVPAAGVVGVVWAWLTAAQLRQAARRRSVFIDFKIRRWLGNQNYAANRPGLAPRYAAVLTSRQPKAEAEPA
jgi:hypothetical protein